MRIEKTLLYIGRFQPPHSNHFAIIKKGLEEAVSVCVGIRVTKMDQNNPLSAAERESLLRDELGDRVSYVRIPDPFCNLVVRVGRKVGYEVQYLDEETEEYLAAGKGPSGTKTREAMRARGELVDRVLEGVIIKIGGASESYRRLVSQKLSAFINAPVFDVSELGPQLPAAVEILSSQGFNVLIYDSGDSVLPISVQVAGHSLVLQPGENAIDDSMNILEFLQEKVA